MSNNKQSSSIEWLISQLKISTYWNTLIAELEFMDLEIDDIIEKAKAMHKEEHGKTWDDSICNLQERRWNEDIAHDDFDEYYNETYGGNNGNTNSN